MAESTISSVAAELVAAGWQRQDPDCRGHYQPWPGRDWWCCSCEPGLDDDGDQMMLTLHAAAGWCCTVAGAGSGRGEIVDITMWSPVPDCEHGACWLTAGWWPGLPAVLAMAEAMAATMPARFMADG